MHNPVEKTNQATQSGVDALRRLPTELQPPYHWQEFKRRARPGSARGTHTDWRYVAAAAALLLLVCGIAIWGRIGGGERQLVADSGPIGDIDALRELQPGWSDTWQPGGSNGEVALAVSRSQAIESWLATLPREPVVVRVGTRAAVAKLEDRIAQVDDLLTSVRLDGRQPDRLVALQRERVRLMGSLAQVRYAEVLASESP